MSFKKSGSQDTKVVARPWGVTGQENILIVRRVILDMFPWEGEKDDKNWIVIKRRV